MIVLMLDHPRRGTEKSFMLLVKKLIVITDSYRP